MTFVVTESDGALPRALKGFQGEAAPFEEDLAGEFAGGGERHQIHPEVRQRDRLRNFDVQRKRLFLDIGVELALEFPPLD